MAIITNYATLQTAIADYLNRSDLTTFLPNFTQNAESTLYKTLRIRAMENTFTSGFSGGTVPVPTSPVYVELKYAWIDGAPITMLTRVSAQQIYQLAPNRSAGGSKPKYIAVEASNFIFAPYPAGTLSLSGVYYGRLTALSASNTTNWFTTYAPDLLLYGSLLEAEPFLANDPRIQVWRALYARAYAAVESEEKKQQASGGKLATRTS